MDELLRYYYDNKAGRAPDTDIQEQLTLCTINYLFDNGLSTEEIFGAIDRSSPKDKMYWMPEDLPDDLWIINPQRRQNKKTGEQYEQQDNLIERDTFYYHPRLKITSKPPYITNRGIEITEPFFCEPVIRFTVQDLVNYYYNVHNLTNELIENSVLVGQARAMYAGAKRRINFISPIDYLLFIIDFKDNVTNTLTSIDIDKNVEDTYRYLKGIVANAHAEGKDKIVWRHQRWLGKNMQEQRTDISEENYSY